MAFRRNWCRAWLGKQLYRTAQTEAVVMARIGRTIYEATYRCLPDTIDPRGLKAK